MNALIQLPTSIRYPLIACVFFLLNMGLHFIPSFKTTTGFICNVFIMALTLGLIVHSGSNYYRNALVALKNKKATMSTLVTLGTASGFLYSTIILFFFRHSTLDVHVYFESVVFIIAFVNLGQYLEHSANQRTYQAIKQLIALKPTTAKLVEHGVEFEVSVDSLKKHDNIRVNAGDKVALDGIITEGDAYVDEAMLTGEPLPVHKHLGEPLFAGTVINKGSVILCVSQEEQDTLLAQIIKEVEAAQQTKPPISKLVNKITAIFVPVVILCALLTACIWLKIGPEPKAAYAFIAAMTVLVIACPCALGLAIPTSIRVATGLAAKQGLLIRQGKVLQIAGQINTLFVDKTGTLTEGKPSVVHIENLGQSSSDALLTLAYSLEVKSSHPLAHAINNKALSLKLSPLHVNQFENIDGLGVQGRINGKLVCIGNQAFMQQHQIDVTNAKAKAIQELDKGHTVLFLSVGEVLEALLVVADTIKSEAKEAIEALKHLGIKVVMLTGDNERTANSVGKTLGFDEVRANLLPSEKLEAIHAEQLGNNIVAMVGDGINDAPALSKANIGIAISSGTDIAIESADVVLVKLNLNKLATLVKLSRNTYRNIKENLFQAFIYNTLGIPIAAGILFPFLGILLNPGIAALCMSLSSLSVVLNANRLALQKL